MSKKSRKKRRCWGMFFAGDHVVNIGNGFAARVMPAYPEDVPAGCVPIEYDGANPDGDPYYACVPADDLDPR